jgi:hypothetical protein
MRNFSGFATNHDLAAFSFGQLPCYVKETYRKLQLPSVGMGANLWQFCINFGKFKQGCRLLFKSERN